MGSFVYDKAKQSFLMTGIKLELWEILKHLESARLWSTGDEVEMSSARKALADATGKVKELLRDLEE